MKKFVFFIFILCLRFAGLAQDITGTWEGKFTSNGAWVINDPRLVVEIHLQDDSLLYGITHLYYEGNLYEHYKMLGKWRRKDSLLIFSEVSTIAVDLGYLGNCLGTYKMTMTRQGNELIQTGGWVPNIKGCTSFSLVSLRKVIPPPPPKPLPVKKNPPPTVKKPSPQQPVVQKPTAQKPVEKNNAPIAPVTVPVQKPVISQPTVKAPVVLPPKLSQRQMDVQSLLEIASKDKDSIRVEVYDNGEIDGDTVSVYVEDKERIGKKMITAKPITFYVSLNKDVNPITHIRLVAESLGSIPPCTALMIITTKSKRYEVRLASNFSKNATVELFLKE